MARETGLGQSAGKDGGATPDRKSLVLWYLGVAVIGGIGGEGPRRKIGEALLAIAGPAGEDISARETSEAQGAAWARGKIEALSRELRSLGWSAPATKDFPTDLTPGTHFYGLGDRGWVGEGWSLGAGWLALAEANDDARREGESNEDLTKRALADLEIAARILGFLGVAHERWAMSDKGKRLDGSEDNVEERLASRLDRLAQREKMEEIALRPALRKRKAAL